MTNLKKVVNVKGSSSNRPSSGSWTSKLEKVSSVCQVNRCTNKATAGMHVRAASTNSSNKQYIVQGCSKHNNYHNTSVMTLKKGTCTTRALKK